MKIILLLATLVLSVGAFGFDIEKPIDFDKTLDLDGDRRFFANKLANEKINLEQKFPNRGSSLKAKLDFDLAVVNMEHQINVERKNFLCDKHGITHCSPTPEQLLREKDGRSAALINEFNVGKKNTADHMTKLTVLCRDGDTDSCSTLNALKEAHSDQHGEDFQEPKTPQLKNIHLPKSCEWAIDMPRRVIQTKGCKSETCVGYVVCNVPGSDLKTVRMSTCSPKNCNDGDAVACTKEPGFSSKKKGEFEGVSKKVRKAMGINGAINE